MTPLRYVEPRDFGRSAILFVLVLGMIGGGYMIAAVFNPSTILLGLAGAAVCAASVYAIIKLNVRWRIGY